ncbi:MAG: hypothetical protein KC766_34570, partial [Myxococcales bacterium]|nr:hypothetical protein [Myxococcales bacterium]
DPTDEVASLRADLAAAREELEERNSILATTADRTNTALRELGMTEMIGSHTRSMAIRDAVMNIYDRAAQYRVERDEAREKAAIYEKRWNQKDRGTTHSDACWQWHLGCAMARCDTLERERDQARAEAECHSANHDAALDLLDDARRDLAQLRGTLTIVNQQSAKSDEARDTFEREAVQHGAATWQVDADGERVFRWNESEVRDGE